MSIYVCMLHLDNMYICVGLVFGYNITHTNLIDYDRISYARSSLAQISRMVRVLLLLL